MGTTNPGGVQREVSTFVTRSVLGFNSKELRNLDSMSDREAVIPDSRMTVPKITAPMRAAGSTGIPEAPLFTNEIADETTEELSLYTRWRIMGLQEQCAASLT
jgi:hypothetical protein